MKNADVLRLAKAMLTPAVEEDTSTDTDPDPDDGSGGDSGGSDGGVGSLPDDGVATLSLTPDYIAVTPTFSLKDPITLERLQALLEFAVRMLYPKGLLAGHDLPAPVYPLDEEDEFPLPDDLAAATASLTAWMLSGEAKLKTAYDAALDGYLATLEAKLSPIVNRY
ncbi:MAG: hypothetical protein IJW98_07595 [Clostridia bacterium]|nr:hypothetical protein [Clostridia bacterium]